MSLMIVTCGDCGARFHLDPALLKDSSAARIRCRKCGGLIVVRLHEESPVPVLPPQETIPPSTVEPAAPAQEPVSPWPVEPPAPAQEWVSPWPVEPPAPAQEPPSFEADISGVVTSEPIPPPPEEKAVLPDNVSIEPEPEPAQPGTVYSRLEDMFADPLPPEEYPAGEYPPEETAATEPGRKAPSRPRTLHAHSPRPLRVVDSPSGRRHVLLRNHEVRARYVGQAVRGFRIVAHGERPGDAGLRHPGREVARRQGSQPPGTSSSSRGPSRTSGTSQAQGSASRRPCWARTTRRSRKKRPSRGTCSTRRRRARRTGG